MIKSTVKIILTIVLLILVIICGQVVNVYVPQGPVALLKELLTSEDESVEEQADSLASDEILEALEDTQADENAQDEKETKHLRDKSLLYDDANEVVTMYLTVSYGNMSEGTDHTWEEVNTYSTYYYEELGVDRYKVEGLLQVGDENGPTQGSLGYDRDTPNAIVQIRGQTSSRNEQKNYKIELKDNQSSWKGQKTIALNKHMSDGLRFRNKMGFDLLSQIDELMSLRTNFVHLYVKDLTSEEEDPQFEDYGLYTQVEQLNKTALRTHGLDKSGHLYKINFFEFYRYEDVIKLTTDKGYDQETFEQYLEIKGSDDHTKLIEMLDDVNDMSIPIEEVMEKHFDMENLTYWMAFNILIGNYDTQSRNTYLYSPLNRDTWYFYCWDIDNSFRHTENELGDYIDGMSWESGVSNYWGNVLFQRCLKSKNFRENLDLAILDLKEKMNEDKLSEMVATYRAVVEPYLYSEPDVEFAPLVSSDYEYVAKELPSLVDFYYQGYLDSLEKPMPFFIGTPQIVEDKTVYSWDASYDFDQESIKYYLTVARDLDFTDVVDSYKDYWNSYEGQLLEPGQYFVRIQAVNESGKSQDAFDYYVNENNKVYGVLCFYVNEDNSISVYTVTE